MPDGSLKEPFPRVATTDMLSMWKCTNCPAQCLPQSAQASTTGTSFFTMIDTVFHSGGHTPWSHRVPHTALQPKLPEASVKMLAEAVKA